MLDICNWLTDEIVLSLSFSLWFLQTPHISPIEVYNTTILRDYTVYWSCSIYPCHDYKLTPWTESTHNALSLAPSQSLISFHISPFFYLISLHTMLFLTIYIPMFTSYPMYRVLACIISPYQVATSSLTIFKSTYIFTSLLSGMCISTLTRSCTPVCHQCSLMVASDLHSNFHDHIIEITL